MNNFFTRWRESLYRGRQARAHDRRGQALYTQGQWEAAISEYREALRLRPDLAIIHYNLGLALYKANQKLEARAAWETVCALTEGKNAYLAEQAAILLRQFG